ncbi:MAG: peptidase MA family metallohydrolase [Candidatus Marinimicrobia bacterium]|nr:peptidase MA family metallohydrolase [Candidatus Neomarinimicrobiota bacterium]
MGIILIMMIRFVRVSRLLILFCFCISLIQSQFYFGRNKIQFEQFDWQVLATNHFDIYYYAAEKKLAKLAAASAEQAFTDLEIKFNHTLNGRVPLVIYSNHIHFQQTNVLPSSIPEGIGGFFEHIKGRVVIPYTGRISDFLHVIRHELVHVFMFSKTMQNIRDRGISNSTDIPLWFSEGLAEWWSVGWDSRAEMVIRDALLHNYLIPLRQVGGYLVYKEGQSFLRYYESNYGADRIRKLMEEFWLYQTFADALAAISGKDYEDLMTEWELSLKQNAAEALQYETLPPSADNRLTESGMNISPAIYRNKAGELHTIYLSNNDGYTNIYSHPLNGQDRSVVIRGERTPNVESLHLLQTNISVNNENIMAFVAKSGARDRIILRNISSNKDNGIYSHKDIVTIRSPAWSPVNKNLVFSGQDFGGQSDLFIWDEQADITHRLTDDIYSDQDPVFSPDGKWILFSSDRGRPKLDNGLDLFLMNLSSAEILYLTQDSFNNIKPRWLSQSPNRIQFITDRSGTPNLWTLTFSHGDDSLKIQPWIKQNSNFHTGVNDGVPTAGDSMVFSVFQNYSYQIHHAPLVQNDSIIQIPLDLAYDNLPWTLDEKPALKHQDKPTPYQLKYSLDLAQTAVSYDPIYGMLGGAQLSLSDQMGNRYYHFLLANSAQRSSDILGRFNAAVTMVDLTRRSNVALGVFHFANDYYDPIQAFYFERSFGVRAGLNFPIHIFRRLEFSTSLWSSEKDFYTGKPVTAFLVSNFISVVHDNTLWFTNGPIDGWRTRITFGPTFDFQRAKFHNYTILFDTRFYYRQNTSLTLAHRTLVWFNDGSDIRRYYIGGSWGLRGYGFHEVYGRKAFMINNELRFPFANSLALNFRSLTIALAPVRGAFFLDVGNAWDYKYPGTLGSIGFGLRGSLMGSFVLRIDMGKKTDFKKLSKGLFTQFFFGWDF